MSEKNLPQGEKTIGPLTGCMLEEALALVWHVRYEYEFQFLISADEEKLYLPHALARIFALRGGCGGSITF